MIGSQPAGDSDAMGRRGPRQHSKASQARRGNPGKRSPAKSRKRGHQELPAQCVAADGSSAGCRWPAPAWLRPLARQKWQETSPILEARGLLTDLDVDTLALYCDAWQEVADADTLLQREGEFCIGDKGLYQHPAVWKRNKAIDRIRKLGTELGLSPNSRRGLDVRTEQADPLSEFLAQRPVT